MRYEKQNTSKRIKNDMKFLSGEKIYLSYSEMFSSAPLDEIQKLGSKATLFYNLDIFISRSRWGGDWPAAWRRPCWFSTTCHQILSCFTSHSIFYWIFDVIHKRFLFSLHPTWLPIFLFYKINLLLIKFNRKRQVNIDFCWKCIVAGGIILF